MQRFHPEKDLDQQSVMIQCLTAEECQKSCAHIKWEVSSLLLAGAVLGCCLQQWPLFRDGYKSGCVLQEPTAALVLTAFYLLVVAAQSVFWFANPCVNNAAALRVAVGHACRGRACLQYVCSMLCC